MNNTLKYWYEMEYFNPCWPVKPEVDINLDKNELPWPKKEENLNLRTTFDIYIGKVSSDKIIEWMISKLNLPSEEKIEKDNSSSSLCALKVDATGKYVIGSFAISSFVWAICALVKNGYDYALDKKTLDLLQESLSKEFIDGASMPVFVSREKLNYIFELICKKICIDTAVVSTSLWVKEKITPGIRINNDLCAYLFPPLETSTELISSRYLNDIMKIQKSPTKKVKDYICSMNSESKNGKIEIDSNVLEMEKWTSPEKYPLGIWPSKYQPCLMQQISINLAISNEQSILSINGPPGTGKTTLLKEIIVSNIVERAIAMLKFTEPDDAFVQYKFKSPPNIYKKSYFVPDEKLTSFGIVVASNNNAAVENISVELPKQIKADRTGRFSLADIKDAKNDDYFSDIASELLNAPAWGLISASLGKRSNIKEFCKALWWSKDENSLKRQFEDSSKKPDWEKAKQNFKTALASVNKSRIEIKSMQNKFLEFKKLKKNMEAFNIQLNASKIKYQMLVDEVENIEMEIINLKCLEETKKNNINYLLNEVSYIKRMLWWFYRSNPLIVKWKSIEAEIQTLVIQIVTHNDSLHNKKLVFIDFENQHKELVANLEQVKLVYDAFSVEIDQYKTDFGTTIPDDKFWEHIENNKKSQEIAPYTNDSYDKQREELFYQALMLNKAFILNSKSVQRNLSALIDMWDGKFISEDRKLAYGSLLNTLMLLVPVISTTFASVESFFEDVGPEELGLLVIDEAGQATPQSALGAIWRSKKVVVVGDPLQVEPIVTIPKELLTRLAKKNNIAPNYKIPELSVQMMCDSLNRYGGTRKYDDQLLWVGCPLILHRRCIEPMFTISNDVAYNGKMLMKTDPDTKNCLSMKESFWLDVKGEMTAKGNQNVKEQNDAAISLFENSLKYTNQLPDIFFISPFKRVSEEIKKKIKLSINRHIMNISDFDKKEWIDAHCGTIHSFQGKEANEVILVMGCDTFKGRGSAAWVGKKPNIINVAVSRAKYRLCIIGNYDQWREVPNVSIACTKLKRVTLENHGHDSVKTTSCEIVPPYNSRF